MLLEARLVRLDSSGLLVTLVWVRQNRSSEHWKFSRRIFVTVSLSLLFIGLINKWLLAGVLIDIFGIRSWSGSNRSTIVSSSIRIITITKVLYLPLDARFLSVCFDEFSLHILQSTAFGVLAVTMMDEMEFEDAVILHAF